MIVIGKMKYLNLYDL